MARRDFLAAACAAPLAITLDIGARVEPIRFAVITDLHHGLAPDSLRRLHTFVQAVKSRRDLDFALQMGDFCHSTPSSEYKPLMQEWEKIPFAKHHVLGNHDMDRGTKESAMRVWGMPARYYAFEARGLRFMTLDLNHYKKAGRLYSYAHGNYFTDNATHNWADPAQLAWLETELSRSRKPTVILSHQPLGIPDANGLPPEQLEVLEILAAHNRRTSSGKVVACMFGHLHVDRLETYAGIPCLCINSASYFWQAGMHPYRDPLWGVVSVESDGIMRLSGRSSEFAKGRPKTEAIGCSASIQDRRLRLHDMVLSRD